MPLFNKKANMSGSCTRHVEKSMGNTTPPPSPSHSQNVAPSTTLPPSSCIPPSTYAPPVTSLPQPTTWKTENSSVTPATTALPPHTTFTSQQSQLPEQTPSTAQASILPGATTWKPENSSMPPSTTELPPHTTNAPPTLMSSEGEQGGSKLPPPTEFRPERSDIVFSVLPPKSVAVVGNRARGR